jgi:hypothetical protein
MDKSWWQNCSDRPLGRYPEYGEPRLELGTFLAQGSVSYLIISNTEYNYVLLICYCVFSSYIFFMILSFCLSAQVILSSYYLIK